MRTLRVLAVSLSMLAAILPMGPAGAERAFGDTAIFARVGDPGMPEGIAVDGDTVFVGTHTSIRGNRFGGPSKIFTYERTTGDLTGEITVEGQALDGNHGILSMAFDADGRLYVLDRNPPRLLRFDLSGDEPVQETYATFPDLPRCSDPLVGPGVPCSPTVADFAPFPDYLAFDEAGNGYVTDLEQAAIFLVRPGGGEAEVWFADPRLDSVFGPNGIQIGPDGETLYFAMTTTMEPSGTLGGIIYTLPVGPERPAAEDLGTFFTYADAGTGPDGIAFGDSGRLYVALAGSNQLSVLEPDGTEHARFPEAVENQMQEVPFDLPASIAFDGDGSLLLTNQSFFLAYPDHWVVFDVWVDDVALPLIRPEIP